ncbi:MAG: AI-2E family transporter, partial [Acidobacteriota bacterium]|nr:AI-2E family transporter [Acidobacteriota bacterium]
SHLLAVITAVVVIAALYFGKDLLIPFALALLLTFLLSPPVTWLEKLRLGHAFSVFIVLVVALGIAGGVIWLGFQQLTGIAQSLPNYQANMIRKLQAVRNPAGTGILGVAQSLDQLKTELNANRLDAENKGNLDAKGNSHAGKPRKVAPVPVEIVRPDSGILSSLGLFGTSVAHYLAIFGAVVVLTLFLLLNRGHLRNRVLRLFGQGHLVLMTTALDDAAQRVSRYLLTQSLVNSTFGILLGTGLYFIGVPYAPFWGVLGAIMRFIPYVGTFIAGACPFILSLAVFDGWTRPLMTFGLFVAIEGTTSTVIEPWLYSTRTGISSLAILLSAAFWTLLWGPIGLILSTPLTVCLAVLGRHLAPFEFLYVLLGDEPVLEPKVHYYQRLLASDEDEAAEVIETYMTDKSLVEAYDAVIIPALGLAEQDRHENRLTEERATSVYQTTRELVEEIGDRHAPADAPVPQGPEIACIPARDAADAVVALMLAQILWQNGYQAKLVETAGNGTSELLFVSALPPFAIMHARSLCRKLRRQHPNQKIALAVWNSTIPAATIKERLGPGCTDWVVTTLNEALATMKEAEVPASEPELAKI